MIRKGLLEEENEHENLEDSFDRKVAIIFPTNSPVNRLSGSSDVETPMPLKRGVFSGLSKRILNKLKPLLKAQENSNKVYSNGYFEGHYPDADKKLKGLLHDSTMAAWANAMSEEEEEERNESNVTLTICINK